MDYSLTSHTTLSLIILQVVGDFTAWRKRERRQAATTRKLASMTGYAKDALSSFGRYDRTFSHFDLLGIFVFFLFSKLLHWWKFFQEYKAFQNYNGSSHYSLAMRLAHVVSQQYLHNHKAIMHNYRIEHVKSISIHLFTTPTIHKPLLSTASPSPTFVAKILRLHRRFFLRLELVFPLVPLRLYLLASLVFSCCHSSHMSFQARTITS